MDEAENNKVFKKIQKCMNSLVGGSGHLSSYSMIKETFKIIKIESLENGNKIFHFSSDAYYETEFEHFGDDSEWGAVPVEGSIVLDNDYNYVRDSKGNILLEPYTCIDPEKYKEKKTKSYEPKKNNNSEISKKGDDKTLSNEEINRLLDSLNED